MTAACGDKMGTVAGVNRHRKAWESACDDCRAAAAAYARERRATSAKAQAQVRVDSEVRTRAMRALIMRHRGEWVDLLVEARQAVKAAS